MSNFQRTRSKVWWGDSPPNIGSPVAQASNWENRAHQQTPRPAENDWEPQLPQWVSPRAEETPSPQVDNVWARRHSSPSSHKSQDSGFSDSDSSPPVGQQNVKKAEEPKNAENPEENNNQCCKHGNQSDIPEKEIGTPKQNRVFDTPIRSVIKTPKDVQNYLQAHCDIGHKSFDLVKCDTNGGCSKEILKNTPKQILITPHKNINNNEVFDKFDAKKKLFDNAQSYSEDTTDNNANMEYIQLSPNHQIIVNNQPRMRSPITRVNCDESIYSSGRFHRNRLNKSLNYKTQRLDEQILDDDGPHSLSCVEEYHFQQSTKSRFEGNTAKALCTRKITDSLNLKTPKKSIVRTKQKMQTKPSKVKNSKGFFNFLPKKNDSIKTIYDITRNVDDRVPTLGLPNSHDIDDWVLIGHCDELNIPNVPTVTKSPKGILKTPTKYENLPKTETLEEDLNFCEMKMNACTSTPKVVTVSNIKNVQLFSQREIPKIKPINLLPSFNESECEVSNQNCKPKNTHITPLEDISRNQPAPVKHWLCELVGLYEPECTTTLQSKALGVEFNANVANSSATITGNIRKVQTHGQIIAHQYKQVMKDLKKINSYDVQHCNNEINMMTANINEFVFAHSITLKIKPPGETPERWDKIKVALQDNIQKVTDIIEDVKVELNETYPEINILQKYLQELLNIFLETARAVLVQQMRTLVSMLEEPPSDMILKSTLISLGHLGALMSPEDDIITSDNEMNFITKLPFVECGVPRALLSVIIESNKSSIKALSLRALATICTSSEAVEQLEEAGGMEILSDVLSEESNPEPQIKEAVTVLTQITGPWLQGTYKLKHLDKYLETNVKSVTAILTKTSCCQLLLLCAACLVNMVNLVKQKEREQLSLKENDSKHCDIIEILSRHTTVESLLEAVKKRGPNASIFLQEQTATFINVLSSSSKGQLLLANCPATAVALICFLRVPCTSPARSARLQAEFRLINQSTEALARLCLLREITTQIIQLEGVSRLVRVIEAQKMQKADIKRSDKILVNCLRALRAIAKNHNDCFKDIDCDVTDMIKPPLMESVKFYSAKQESYV